MRTALLLVVGLVACRSAPSGEAPPPPPTPSAEGSGAARAHADLGQAKVTLGCLFERARYARDVPRVLADVAPAPIVRLAAFTAIERARRDGDSPAEAALADAIRVLTQLEDLEGLREAFAMVDALPGPRGNLFAHDAPARAGAGVSALPDESARDKTAVIRELMIANQGPAATKLFATIEPKDIDDTYEQEPYLGALVALGKVAEARAVIAKQPLEDRFKLTGVWLDVVLRQGAAVAEGLAAARAELVVAPAKALTWFPTRTLLARAIRVGRARELAPLFQALLARLAAQRTPPGPSDLDYDLALALGDQAAAARFAADPVLAAWLAARAAPLDTALAAALATKDPNDDLVRVWARSIADGADPTFGARLAAAVCPKATPPTAPATPAVPGLTLTVTEKARKKQFQCANHDVVVRLMRGTTVVGEEALEGECHGPCTAAEQRAGKAQLAAIEKEIEAGTASESATDYNFTECMFAGPNVGRIDKVGGRDVALIAHHYIGEHDVDKDAWQLALEVCGALHVTETFGGMYAGSWDLGQLHVREAAGQIIVDGASEKWRGVVFRLTLPACPGAPVEQTLETE